MISGNQIDAQAATVESYLHEHFSTGQFFAERTPIIVGIGRESSH